MVPMRAGVFIESPSSFPFQAGSARRLLAALAATLSACCVFLMQAVIGEQVRLPPVCSR